jgi:hypothetical protein
MTSALILLTLVRTTQWWHFFAVANKAIQIHAVLTARLLLQCCQLTTPNIAISSHSGVDGPQGVSWL